MKHHITIVRGSCCIVCISLILILGITFSSASVLSGSTEGQTILYRRNQYPLQAIGPASFLWRPVVTTSTNSSRTLWLWLHPSIYDETVFELLDVFQIPRAGFEELKKLPKFSQTQYKERQPHVSVPVLSSPSAGITMRLLRDKLCRFRLTGALAHQTLMNVVKSASVELSSDEARSDGSWWKTYFSGAGEMCVHKLQQQAMNELAELSSAAYLPPRTVLGITCRDPRVFLPSKKIQPEIQNAQPSKSAVQNDNCATNLWPIVSDSPVWDADVRENVKSQRFSDQEMNRKRQLLTLPGLPLELGEDESRVPLLLIQRPGQEELQDPATPEHPVASFESGWDVILPSGWAMGFWIALVYNGARVGGLLEMENMALEAGRLEFPRHWPDTQASQEEATEEAKCLRAKDEKKPPSKRVNFKAFQVDFPYSCPWSRLVGEWEEAILSSCAPNGVKNNSTTDSVGDAGTKLAGRQCEVDKVLVVKDQIVLRKLQLICSAYSRETGSLKKQGVTAAPVDRPVVNCSLTATREEIKEWGRESRSLVPVRLTMLHKGTCHAFAQICIPSLEDFRELNKSANYSGPTQPPSMLKAKNADDVVKSSRTPLGYVCSGGFSLRRGCGAGVGYVVLGALIKTLNALPWMGKTLLLVRANNSLQYRFAIVEVIT